MRILVTNDDGIDSPGLTVLAEALKAIGEVWVYDNEQFSRYLRADELHLGFNFRLLRAKLARDYRELIRTECQSKRDVGSRRIGAGR